jgi:hypothetical protein
LLLGWLGSQKQHLDKYAEMYQGILNADVAILQPSLLQTAIPSLAHRGVFKFFDDTLATKQKDGPVLVHCMSNAGWLAFGTILHLTSFASAEGTSPALNDPRLQSALAFKDRILNNRLRGIVIDSAPSYALPGIWARGTVAAALGKSAETINEDLPSTVAAVQHLAERYLALPSISRHLRQTRAAWTSQLPLDVPQLYLYSTADNLIPFKQIESFIQGQQQRGVAISSHSWDDSGHCEHLRVHPEQYTRLVHSFVERCLTDIPAAASTL